MAAIHIVNPANILNAAALTLEDDRFIGLSQDVFGVPNFECMQWLAARRLIANSRMCIACVVPMPLIADADRSDGYVWRCRRCRCKVSVRSGSFFERGHLSMQTITAFVYLWSRDTQLRHIMHELNINTWQTAVDWGNFCQDICGQWAIDHPIEIGGMDNQGQPIVVEIDESYFLWKKYHRGRLRAGKWVFE